MTSDTSAPIEPDKIYNSDGTEAGPPRSTQPGDRILYWHVFGAPLEGKRGGKKNYLQVTAGPVHKAADPEVTQTTIEGAHGELLQYQGTFTEDPSTKQLLSLRPEAYRR